MVNSIFPERQEQGWLWRFAIFALVCATTSSAVAQQPYYNNQYKIVAQAPAARVARAASPSAPQPFTVEIADPPAPSGTNAPNTNFEALSKTFSANNTREAKPTGRVQDIFGENPQGDIFGEETAQQPPENPFQKVDPPQQPNGQVPENPFGEITPREDTTPQLPGGNPFNALPSDPTPITPPMDTRPQAAPRQVEPQLPEQYTPDPNLVNPNPPIPGQPDPNNNDPGELPEIGNPETDRPRDDEASVFEGKEDPEINEEKPDNSDVPPVPQPASSRVYLPARTPTDYVSPTGKHAMVIPPGYYDPRMLAAQNPYANLPGPYGYGVPPQAYMPGMMPMPPMPYGQCGPGCTPTNQCGSCNSCKSCNNTVASSCGGCGSCGDCGSVRPTLAGTDVVDIGDRIVETGCVDPCAPDTYVDVVSDCDNVCSNFASCYIGLFGGLTDLNELITRSNVGRGVYTEDSGYMFGLTVGQIQGRNLRTELELSYRNIGINGLRLDGDVPSQFVGVTGDFGTFAGMFNGYWEFVDAPMGSIKPYIGGGIGFAIGRPDLIQADGMEAVINNDDSSFAWQAMAGLNYKASPTLDAFLEYRYFVADSFRLDTEIPEFAGLGNGSGPFEYQSSNVLFGLRVRF